MMEFKFTVNTSTPTLQIKAKYVPLSKKDKISLFIEKVIISKQNNTTFFDPVNPSDREARNWLNSELSFLTAEEKKEINDLWNYSYNDPIKSRLFYKSLIAIGKNYEY